MKIKLLQPNLKSSPFSFFFRFFIGIKQIKIKSNEINENFEFELRQAFTEYCAAIKVIPETCFYEITQKPSSSDVNQWSYLKGIVNLNSLGETIIKTPFKYGSKYVELRLKNKKNQIILGEENLEFETKGKNICFNLFFHKNPKHKQGKLLIDLTSGN